MENVFIYIPGFQPLSEDGLIHENMSQELIVGNLIEAAPDVAFENPLAWLESSIH
jgi:hypothetical protein